MSLAKIIGQYKGRLDTCGLTAEVRFFESLDIRAIYYQGHVALSANATIEEAHRILLDACSIASCPIHMACVKTQHLRKIHNESVAVWGPDSLSKSSQNTA